MTDPMKKSKESVKTETSLVIIIVAIVFGVTSCAIHEQWQDNTTKRELAKQGLCKDGWGLWKKCQ